MVLFSLAARSYPCTTIRLLLVVLVSALGAARKVLFREDFPDEVAPLGESPRPGSPQERSPPPNEEATESDDDSFATSVSSSSRSSAVSTRAGGDQSGRFRVIRPDARFRVFRPDTQGDVYESDDQRWRRLLVEMEERPAASTWRGAPVALESMTSLEAQIYGLQAGAGGESSSTSSSDEDVPSDSLFFSKAEQKSREERFQKQVVAAAPPRGAVGSPTRHAPPGAGDPVRPDSMFSSSVPPACKSVYRSGDSTQASSSVLPSEVERELTFEELTRTPIGQDLPVRPGAADDSFNDYLGVPRTAEHHVRHGDTPLPPGGTPAPSSREGRCGGKGKSE